MAENKIFEEIRLGLDEEFVHEADALCALYFVEEGRVVLRSGRYEGRAVEAGQTFAVPAREALVMAAATESVVYRLRFPVEICNALLGSKIAIWGGDFVPLPDGDFREKIEGMYAPGVNVNQIIQQSGLPATTFRRRFRSVFGVSVSQWLATRRNEEILQAITSTDTPFADIARLHSLTPEYLSRLCAALYGASPSALRAAAPASR